MRIFKDTLDILSKEPNIKRVPMPCVVLGDIHGQLFDLINVLSKKNPSKQSYMLLGDYVDRGRYSIETLTLLLAVKLNHPKTFGMLRGNHESRQCAEHFSFRQEMLFKYDEELFELSL